MARTYIELRGITIGTTAELAGHTADMAEDQAAYNTETHQLFMGPGTIASKQIAAKASIAAGDKVLILDSEDGFKLKTVLQSIQSA